MLSNRAVDVLFKIWSWFRVLLIFWAWRLTELLAVLHSGGAVACLLGLGLLLACEEVLTRYWMDFSTRS